MAGKSKGSAKYTKRYGANGKRPGSRPSPAPRTTSPTKSVTNTKGVKAAALVTKGKAPVKLPTTTGSRAVAPTKRPNALVKYKPTAVTTTKSGPVSSGAKSTAVKAHERASAGKPGMRAIPSGLGLPSPDKPTPLKSKAKSFFSPKLLLPKALGAIGAILTPTAAGRGSDIYNKNNPLKSLPAKPKETKKTASTTSPAPTSRPAVKKATAASKPTYTTRGGEKDLDSLTMNTLVKAGYRPNQLNKMSNTEIRKLYNELKSKK